MIHERTRAYIKIFLVFPSVMNENIDSLVPFHSCANILNHRRQLSFEFSFLPRKSNFCGLVWRHRVCCIIPFCILCFTHPHKPPTLCESSFVIESSRRMRFQSEINDLEYDFWYGKLQLITRVRRKRKRFLFMKALRKSPQTRADATRWYSVP